MLSGPYRVAATAVQPRRRASIRKMVCESRALFGQDDDGLLLADDEKVDCDVVIVGALGKKARRSGVRGT